MKKPKINKTIWTVEWKDLKLKWHSQKFYLYQEAAGFCQGPECQSARTVLIRESKENEKS